MKKYSAKLIFPIDYSIHKVVTFNSLAQPLSKGKSGGVITPKCIAVPVREMIVYVLLIIRCGKRKPILIQFSKQVYGESRDGQLTPDLKS